jgi:mono/diheme cytochrome c family protein
MRNILKSVVLAAFVVAGIFIFAARGTQATSAFVSEAKFAGLASPRTLYVQNCARCHGSNGKAQTALGKKLEADDLTASTAGTSKIIRIITNGKGKMPSFRKKLTAAQITSLAGYVRSL